MPAYYQNNAGSYTHKNFLATIKTAKGIIKLEIK